MRAFNEQQLASMENGASPEVEALVREVRRLYEAEDRQAQTNGAVCAMLAGIFQRLQGEGRAVDAVIRMLAPAAPQQPATGQEQPAKRRPRMMMDEQPE